MKLFKIQTKKSENDFIVTFQERPSEDGIRKCALFNVFNELNGEPNPTDMVAYARIVTSNKRHFGYFAEMYIRKNYQCNGIGQKLLDIRTEYAQNNDCTKLGVMFHIDEHLEKRKHLYVRNGWTITPSTVSAIRYITPAPAEQNKHLPPPHEMSEAKLSHIDFETQTDEVIKSSLCLLDKPKYL